MSAINMTATKPFMHYDSDFPFAGLKKPTDVEAELRREKAELRRENAKLKNLRRENAKLKNELYWSQQSGNMIWRAVDGLRDRIEDNARAELSREITVIVYRMMTPYRTNGVLVRPAAFPSHITNDLWEQAEALNHKYTCPVCLDLMTRETFTMTPCGHELCIECAEKIAMSTNNCPVCRQSLARE